MEWIAYCTTCGELDRAPNGPMMESTARLHRRDTGHMTIIGYEPSIIMSGEMVEVKTGEEPTQGYYWEVTNMVSGERLQSGKMHWNVNNAVRDAKKTLRSGYQYYEDNHLVIKVFDKSPDERAGLTLEPEHSESFWVKSEAGTKPSRPFPEVYGDWVNVAEDIKAKYPDDPVMRASVNYQLQQIAEETEVADEAKSWLMRKAGELGIK